MCGNEEKVRTMDWTTIIAVPLLAAIGGWFGSYFQGYMSEKGKNLATHEDIDKLVDQVKAVTQTTKEIEAKISDQVWDRQRRWELKRDQIVKLADQMSIAKDALVHLDAGLREARTFGDSVGIVTERFDKKVFSFTASLDDLDRLAMTSRLTCSPATCLAVTVFTCVVREVARDLLEDNVELDFDHRHANVPKEFTYVMDTLVTELS